MKEPASTPSPSASELIDRKIAGLADWRGQTLARMRSLIRRAEGEEVDAGAFKALVREAIALNATGAKAKPRRATQ